jgi:hypothetical protein
MLNQIIYIMEKKALLKAVKTLLKSTPRATLGQISIIDEGDALLVVPNSDAFGAIELCGVVIFPLTGYFFIRDGKVVLRIC